MKNQRELDKRLRSRAQGAVACGACSLFTATLGALGPFIGLEASDMSAIAVVTIFCAVVGLAVSPPHRLSAKWLPILGLAAGCVLCALTALGWSLHINSIDIAVNENEAVVSQPPENTTPHLADSETDPNAAETRETQEDTEATGTPEDAVSSYTEGGSAIPASAETQYRDQEKTDLSANTLEDDDSATPENGSDLLAPATADTTDPSVESTSSSAETALDPEFKQAVDDYESFINEFCDFLDKYEAEGAPSEMLPDYLLFIANFNQLATDFTLLADPGLTAEEEAYYNDASLRVLKRLSEEGL